MGRKVGLAIAVTFLSAFVSSGLAIVLVAESAQTCSYRIDILMVLHSVVCSSLVTWFITDFIEHNPFRLPEYLNDFLDWYLFFFCSAGIFSVIPELHFSVEMADLCSRLPPLKVRIFIYCFTGFYGISSVIFGLVYYIARIRIVISHLRILKKLGRTRSLINLRTVEMITKDRIKPFGWKRYVEEPIPTDYRIQRIRQVSCDLLFIALFLSKAILDKVPSESRQGCCRFCEQRFKFGERLCFAPIRRKFTGFSKFGLEFEHVHTRCLYLYESAGDIEDESINMRSVLVNQISKAVSSGEINEDSAHKISHELLARLVRTTGTRPVQVLMNE